MIYVSADIETTGLDLDHTGNCSILQFAAIIEDSSNPRPLDQLPKFSCFCYESKISGESYALALNSWIIKILAEYEKDPRSIGQDRSRQPLPYYDNKQLPQPSLMQFVAPTWMMPHMFIDWYRKQRAELDPTYVARKSGTKEVIDFAGKNFATFDKRFLEALPNWCKHVIIRPRIIDPAVLFIDWKTDTVVPSLSECKKRAGLESTVTHDAVDDALDVIRVLRSKY